MKPEDVLHGGEACSGELWVEMPDAPGYYVSSFGRIWSTYTNKFRIQTLSNAGYFRVQLGAGKPKRLVHRIVARAFCAGYFDGAVVNHKDGDKENNKCSNLEWVTPSDNARHAYKMGRFTGAFKKKPCGVVHPSGRFSIFDSVRDAANTHKVSLSKVYAYLQKNKGVPEFPGVLLRGVICL